VKGLGNAEKNQNFYETRTLVYYVLSERGGGVNFW
jgi:hypothetical protein